jgi:hypothetical protein
VAAHIRLLTRLALAALAGSTLAGCGGVGATPVRATPSFTGCPLLPRDHKTGLFLLPGGGLAAMSVEGRTCGFGIRLMTQVIAGLHAGTGTDMHPVHIQGWNCVSYDTNQTTCFRRHSTLYAQYVLF